MKKRMISALLIALVLLALAACGVTEPTEPATTPPTAAPTVQMPTVQPTQPDDKVTYTVCVLDENGNGIANVAVQLCDEACIPGFTGEDGTATFRLPAANYHASVTVLPEGYAHTSEETEFYFEDGQTQLVIVLRAE